MRYIKLFENFLLEYVEISDIYNKYYGDIDSITFNKIIEADPTTILSKNKIGKYSKWLLSLYKSNNLKLEDLYKATEYLTLFNSFQHKLLVKDINKINTLPELYKLVEIYDDKKEEVEFTNEDEQKLIGEFKQVFKNSKYRIIIPLTLKASEYFGKGTEWCTIYPDNFKRYTKNQNPNNLDRNALYILYTENPDDRLQFHFKSRQFMHIGDGDINIKDFFKNNKDIFEFFNKNIENINKYIKPKDIRWSENTLEGAPQTVEGNFICSENLLTSLKGAPQIVEGSFDCENNLLITLEGAPQIVEGGFNCENNLLITLEGAPQIVEGTFFCSDNKLPNLKGAPQTVEGDFFCDSNRLITLEGAPQIVEGGFFGSSNKLTNLIGAPRTVEQYFDCSENLLTSLEGAPQIVEGSFNCRNNPNLSKEEILRYKATGAVKGNIYSDFGDF